MSPGTTIKDFQINEIVLIKDHGWYKTRGRVSMILPHHNLICVQVIERIHRSTGKPGRVSANQVWYVKPNSLEKITEGNHANV